MEEKLEIKYKIPEINFNIKEKLKKNEPISMNKFIDHLENMENIRNNSIIMTEISNSKMKIPSQIGNQTILMHNLIKCGKCQIMPIIGNRYKCPKCLNYNLCENCEELNSEMAFHPHSNFILCRILETAPPNPDYSYQCLMKDMKIYQKQGVESFTFPIKLKNNGNLKWPESNTIIKCNKEKSTIFCDKCVLPSININDNTEIMLNFKKCSKIPSGKYFCYIILYINGKIIRNPMEIKVFIE